LPTKFPLSRIVLAAATVLTLVALGIAQTSHSPLPLSPLSSSVLMTQAVRQGKVHLTGAANSHTRVANVTCSPAPCVLPNVNVSESAVLANETPVIVSPTNPSWILSGANDYACPNVQGFYASSDGGSTWTRTCMNNLSGMSGEGDPGVGYDLRGNAYISGIDAAPSLVPGVIILESSTDNGQTWSAPRQAVPNMLGGLTDKPWMEIDTNRNSPFANSIYISVTQFDATQNNTQISVSHSSDGGNTWTNVLVGKLQIFPAVDTFTDLAIGEDGTVYLSWMHCVANGPTGDCGGTKATMMFSESKDGGNTWTAPRAIFSANLVPDPNACCFYGSLPNTFERMSNIPVIAVDNSNSGRAGNLFIAFYTWTGQQMRVYVARSLDGGTSWVAQPISIITNDQFFPWLNISNQGHVGVTWDDRRNDPANVNYESFASILGHVPGTYPMVFDLSANPSNPFNDGFGGFFIGDYTGNAWGGSTLYNTYTDTSTGIDQDFMGGVELH